MSYQISHLLFTDNYSLSACKKDNSNFPQAIAGVYNGTWICSSFTPPNSYVYDTTSNMIWTVTILGDSSINVNGNQMSLSGVQQTSYMFQGVSQNFISGGYACELTATFNASLNSMQISAEGHDGLYGCGGTFSK